jgi:hypothetical protein
MRDERAPAFAKLVPRTVTSHIDEGRQSSLTYLSSGQRLLLYV